MDKVTKNYRNEAKIKVVEESLSEAKRFVVRAEKALAVLTDEDYCSYTYPEWADAKRSAIDLGKELSKFNRKL